MAFWNNIQKGLTDATAFTAKKTVEITDSAKSKYNLFNLKNKLEKCYTSLGKLYLDTRRNGEDHESEILTLIMQIDKIEADIAFIKKNEAESEETEEDVEDPAE
ncbi:MAG: hypothetical protein IKM46_06265 [Clostridia bacterium]|nr:hypothetical protein [Clostridia bacterium]